MRANKLLTNTDIQHFEEMIYLPMLLTILERDAEAVEEIPFKFKSPYLLVIKRASDQIHKQLEQTHIYFREHRLQLIKGGNDGTFATYTFVEGVNEYERKYMNYRLRNRSEELLSEYLGAHRGI